MAAWPDGRRLFARFRDPYGSPCRWSGCQPMSGSSAPRPGHPTRPRRQTRLPNCPLLAATVNFPFVATENFTPWWLAGADARGWRVYRVTPTGTVMYDEWIDDDPANGGLAHTSCGPCQRARKN